MTDYFRSLDALTVFSREKAAKVDVIPGRHLFVGLNCFEPGQTQSVHVHAASDKFYLVLSGKARMVVGDVEQEAGSGTLVWAPAHLPHGVKEAVERTVMLVVIAPPPENIRSPKTP
jgi:quercetin dioxygenase-like cupin family protein